MLDALVNGLILGSSYALVALGFTLVYGILGFINFAHGNTYMIGAVLGFEVANVLGTDLHWSATATYWTAVVAATVGCAVLGIVLERVGFRPFRRQKIGAMITSIGLAILLSNGVAYLWGTQPRFFTTPYVGHSVRLGSIGVSVQRVLVFALSVVAIGALYAFIRKSYTGKVIRAVAQDSEVAGLMGIAFNRVTVLVFALAGALAGLAGVVVSPLGVVDPYMGTVIGLTSFAVVVLGGLGNVEGTIVAGFVVGITESLGSTFVSDKYADTFVFALMILTLLVRPTGLLGKAAERA